MSTLPRGNSSSTTRGRNTAEAQLIKCYDPEPVPHIAENIVEAHLVRFSTHLGTHVYKTDRDGIDVHFAPGTATGYLASLELEVKSDLALVKSDLALVKSDLALVKSDVTGIKSELKGLKFDVTTLAGSVKTGFEYIASLLLKGGPVLTDGSMKRKSVAGLSSTMRPSAAKKSRNTVTSAVPAPINPLDKLTYSDPFLVTGVHRSADVRQVLQKYFKHGQRMRAKEPSITIHRTAASEIQTVVSIALSLASVEDKDAVKVRAPAKESAGHKAWQSTMFDATSSIIQTLMKILADKENAAATAAGKKVRKKKGVTTVMALKGRLSRAKMV